MDRFLMLRIVLTIVAILGMGPVTLAFSWFVPFLLISMAATGSYGYQSLVIGFSTVALCGCWKAYTLAMAVRPTLRREWLAIVGTLVALAWGGIWGKQFEKDPTWQLGFLMPGLTATVMLMVTAWRSWRAPSACVNSKADR